MTNAQEWLDREYPKNGTYNGFPNVSFYMPSSNVGKKREEIKKLDIWAISNLKGSLKLEGFTSLEEFNCWRNSLTKLDLSGCPNLKVISCGSNNLRKLTLGNLKNLVELDCSNNRLTKLNIGGCPRLEKLISNNNYLSPNNLSFALMIYQESERERWGKIKKIVRFNTWFNKYNKHCALIITKDDHLTSPNSWYSIKLAIREPLYESIPMNSKVMEIFSGFSQFEEAKEEVKKIKKILKSENPNSFLKNYKWGIIEREMEGDKLQNPNSHIKKYDIIARPIRKSGGWLWHYGIYLGDEKVAHYGYGEVDSVFKTFKEGEVSNESSWEEFLDGEKEVIIKHPLIPARKNNVIEDSIRDRNLTIIFAKYNLLSRNCEHFASKHVIGQNTSEQANMVSDLTATSVLVAGSIIGSVVYNRILKKD